MDARSFLVMIAMLWCPAGVFGQEEEADEPREFHSDPVVRIVVRGFDWEAYARELRAKQPAGTASLLVFTHPGISSEREFTPQRLLPAATDCDFTGSMIFVSKQQVPEFELVRFRSLKDESEFRKLVVARQQSSPGSELNGKNDRYELKPTGSFIVSGKQHNMQRVLIVDSSQSSYVRLLGLPEPTYFRRVGTTMFEASFPELLTMSLPDLRRLQTGSKERSLTADVDLAHIPRRTRSTFANMIRNAGSPQLQQRDAESNPRYAFRRALGDFLSEQIRQLVTDLDTVRLSVRLTSEQTLKTSLKVSARSGSALDRMLRETGKARTRFPGPDSEADSAFDFRGAVRLPESARHTLRAALALARSEVALASRGDTASLLQAIELATATVDASELALLLGIRGDDARGVTLTGAVRLDDAEAIAAAISRFTASADSGLRVSTSEDAEGLRYLSVSGLPPGDGSWRAYAPGGFHFVAFRSTLWFAAGGDSALDVLKRSIEAMRSQREAAPDLVTVEMDLKKLAGAAETPDEFSRVPAMLLTWLQNSLRLPGGATEVAYVTTPQTESGHPLPKRKPQQHKGTLRASLESIGGSLVLRAELDAEAAEFIGRGLTGRVPLGADGFFFQDYELSIRRPATIQLWSGEEKSDR